jgi:hypothetical protein
MCGLPGCSYYIFFLRKLSFLIPPFASYIFIALFDTQIYSFSFKQTLEDNRHTFDKVHYKKSSIRQSIDERDELIDELLTKSIELNDKVSNS